MPHFGNHPLLFAAQRGDEVLGTKSRSGLPRGIVANIRRSRSHRKSFPGRKVNEFGPAVAFGPLFAP